MLILITSEDSDSTEKELLIDFFDRGLPLLHVRKPGMKEEELKAWLAQFKGKYLRKMILHQHHQLAEVFFLRGIHLKESLRRSLENLSEFIKQFRQKGYTVSTSFHSPEEVVNETAVFDYVFLSPVFSSISKSNYKGRMFNVEALPQKVIALGGIEAPTIPPAKKLGFSGVATLGAIWLAENKQQAFEEIYKTYQYVYS